MDFQHFWQDWLVSFFEYLPKLITGIVIFVISLIGSGLLANSIRRLLNKKVSNNEMLQLIFIITRWSILIVGSILALDQVNFDVTGFIAGIGVAGFTIGFALQDIAKNFISGILLLYRQPFNIGDTIGVSDYEGKVMAINVRDTEIVTPDGVCLIIPNREVFENPIINYTKTPLRRREMLIGLGYDEDADLAIDIFTKTINSVSGVANEPGPTVRATELGDSALILSALFWVDQQKNDLLGVHSDVVKAIKVTAEEHQINLPYPVQTILLQNTES